VGCDGSLQYVACSVYGDGDKVPPETMCVDFGSHVNYASALFMACCRRGTSSSVDENSSIPGGGDEVVREAGRTMPATVWPC